MQNIVKSKHHRRQLSWHTWILMAALGWVALFASACGSGGGGGADPVVAAPATVGWEVPSEISAVPPSQQAAGQVAALANPGLKTKVMRLAKAAADPGTDYTMAKTSKYVEEPTLEQFAIIEQVLNAINQTHYADEENIGAGPYKCIVAWEDEREGVDVKVLEPWIVDSEQITENGQPVLRVRAWIEEIEKGEVELVKAEFKVYEPASRNADGSYNDYGVWSMNVKFNDDADDFFAASASVGANGEIILKMQESFLEEIGPGGGELPSHMKAIMYRSDEEGYGKVYYPDWEAIFGPDADPASLTEIPHVSAAYAYNSDYLAVQEEGEEVQYKDRNDVVEMTHRYGVYDGVSGDNVMKSRSFGFPFYYQEGGLQRHGYYGAWQGRHQIWLNGQDATIAEGTEVTREDFGANNDPETYTVGPTFNGVLVKRTYADASLDDIKDMPVEIWINQDYSLLYNGMDGKWYHCKDIDWMSAPPTCNTTPVDFAAEVGYSTLVVEETNHRKHVGIGGHDSNANQQVNFVYALASSGDVPQDGFYEAEETMTDYGPRWTLKTPATPLDTNAVQNLWVFISGSTYVVWNGTGWIEKELINFNQRTWTPEFSDNDKPYSLPTNQELYINMEGVNYVVRKDANGTTVKMELQTAVNPSNVDTIVPDGTVFTHPWHNDGDSTFEFVTDPLDPDYLMLVYRTVSDADSEGGAVAGDIASNVWGIETTYAGDAEPTAFNWEYNAEGGWGSVTYLLNADDTYHLLDDPIRFEAITASNNAGDEKTLVLQFDGWMMGLPHLYEELAKNDFVMTESISNKIINLPAGTQLTEASSGDAYLLKPLEISQFLTVVTEDGSMDLPDITQADSVDLDTVPDFEEHGMGDMPSVSSIKYSEGELVE